MTWAISLMYLHQHGQMNMLASACIRFPEHPPSLKRAAITPIQAFLVALVVKNLCRRYRWLGFDSWVGKVPWRRKRQPTPVFLTWRISRTEEPGGLQFMCSQRVTHDWSGWAHTHALMLIQSDLCPYEIKSTHRHTQSEGHMKIQGEDEHPQARWRDLRRSQLWHWTYSLQDWEKIDFFCLNHPAYGALWWQPSQTKTLSQTGVGARVSHSHYTGSSVYTSKWVVRSTNVWRLVHFCTATLVYGTLLVFSGVTTKGHKVGQVDPTIKDFLLLLPKLLLLMVCCAKLLQSCPTLCNSMDYSQPSSSVRGILQARILEWVVMPSSRGSFQPEDQTHISDISCIGRWVLYHQCHVRRPRYCIGARHPRMWS